MLVQKPVRFQTPSEFNTNMTFIHTLQSTQGAPCRPSLEHEACLISVTTVERLF